MIGALAAVFLLLLCVPLCSAAEIDEMQRRQETAVGVDELERAAQSAGGGAEYGQSLDEGLEDLLRQGGEAAGGILRGAVRSGVILMAVVMLCGLGESLFEPVKEKAGVAISLVGTLAVTAAAVADVKVMLGLGRSTIGTMSSFATVLLPTVTAVTAATGAVSGAAARQLAAALFSDLLVNLIDRLLVPLLYGCLAAAVAHAATGNEGLKRVAGLLKWTVTTVLTTVMLAFVGYLSVSGVIAGNADAVTIKATKFAISGAIPVVGGILSDAAETILASAGVLKGTVGVFGMLTVLGICLLPLLRLAAHYLVYKLAAALSATVGPGRIGGLVDQIGSVFGLMLGMTGACCLLLMVTLVTSVTAVSL